MTDNDELAERLARAIWGHEPNCHGREFEDHSFRDKCTGQAQTALSALRPGDTYNGHMWVPVEPSKKMIDTVVSDVPAGPRRDKAIVNALCMWDDMLYEAARGDE